MDQGTGTYSFTGLVAGTTYHFQIWAYSNEGADIDYLTDPAGPTASAVPIHPQPDSQPTVFAATAVSPERIDLSWTDATGANAPTGYVIYANETGTFSAPTDGTAPVVDDDLSNGSAVVTVDQGTGTYSFTGLVAGTTYHFQIWAYSNEGADIDYLTDTAGPTVSVATLTPVDPEPDNQPTGFTATAVSPDRIDLSWTDATGANAPTGYVIYANETGTFSAPTDGTAPVVDDDLSNGEAVVTVAHGAGTGHTFEGLDASTTYHFQIWAYSNEGSRIDYLTDTPGLESSATPVDPEPDNQPAGFTATAVSPDRIDLSWTDATGTDVPAGYVIYANTDNVFTDLVDGTEPTIDTDLSNGSAVVTVAHGADTGHTFTGLTASTTYHFQIWAYSNEGSFIDYLTDPAGPMASVATLTPVDPEPDNQPAGFTATAVSPTQIDLSWTDATGTNVPAGYVIYANRTKSFSVPTNGDEPSIDTDLSDGSAVVTVAHGAGTGHTFTGLTASTTYHFQIWAYSNEGSFIDYLTDPAGPTVSVTTTSGSEVNGQTVLLEEGFEDDGHTLGRYTASSSGGFNSGDTSHFRRTDGSDITMSGK